MSTRSCIARKTKDGWEGVYHHSDGYPTHLARVLWKRFRDDFRDNEGAIGVRNDGTIKNAIRAFCDVFIDGHPSGYSIIRENDIDCKCHVADWVLRGDNRREMIMDNEEVEALHIEWVYCFDKENENLEVYKSMIFDDSIKLDRVSQKQDFDDKQYTHYRVATIDLNGFEPNWEKLENEVRDFRDDKIKAKDLTYLNN